MNKNGISMAVPTVQGETLVPQVLGHGFVAQEPTVASTSGAQEPSVASTSGTQGPSVASTSGVQEQKTTSCNEPSSSRKRKQPHPIKSPERYDPNFRGAIVLSELVFIDGDWKLMATTTFQPLSLGKKYMRKMRILERKRSVELDDESDSLQSSASSQSSERSSGEKHCASCDTRKTPLWRDAEDGTPLCNACGIRYKKYKIRCARCWHIPKKDEFSPLCKFCGSKFLYSYPRVW